MAKAIAKAGLLSAIASATLSVEHVYADGPFNFSPFSSSPSPSVPTVTPRAHSLSSPAADKPAENAEQAPRVRNDNPRTTSAGFDPEALERGAKALREINSSSHAKKVFIFYFVILFDVYTFC